jgi:hypothetical protein
VVSSCETTASCRVCDPLAADNVEVYRAAEGSNAAIRGLDKTPKAASEDMLVATLLNEDILGIAVEPYGRKKVVSNAPSKASREGCR